MSLWVKVLETAVSGLRPLDALKIKRLGAACRHVLANTKLTILANA